MLIAMKLKTKTCSNQIMNKRKGNKLTKIFFFNLQNKRNKHHNKMAKNIKYLINQKSKYH